MRRSGGTRELDEIDRQLCELLGAAPKTSNRALALAVGVTDETVAARLRRLRDQGVLATTVIVDWEGAGYVAQALVRVKVAGRPFRDVANQLLDHPATHAISETSGSSDGVLSVLATSLDEIHEFVTGQLVGTPGVRETAIELIVHDLKVPPNVLTLPIPSWDPSHLPSPCVALDDLDMRIIRELTSDGHESNSEVARRLGVSDATIRRRIQRLEDHGLIEIVAAFDPVATGDVSAVAFAFCRHAGQENALRSAIDEYPTVIAGYSTLGSSTCVLLLGSLTDADLQQFSSSELWDLPGIQSVDLCLVNEVLLHRSHLGRVHVA